MTNRHKKYLKPGGWILGSLIIGYAIMILGSKTAAEFIAAFAIPALGMLSGLVIGSIGVFLGSIGNLYALLISKKNLPKSDLDEIFSCVNRSVVELKQNIYFVIGAMFLSFILLLLHKIDIPHVNWIFAPQALSKVIVFNTVVLALIILVFVAIFDSITAMFKIHSVYEVIAKESIAVGSAREE